MDPPKSVLSSPGENKVSLGTVFEETLRKEEDEKRQRFEEERRWKAQERRRKLEAVRKKAKLTAAQQNQGGLASAPPTETAQHAGGRRGDAVLNTNPEGSSKSEGASTAEESTDSEDVSKAVYKYPPHSEPELLQPEHAQTAQEEQKQPNDEVSKPNVQRNAGEGRPKSPHSILAQLPAFANEIAAHRPTMMDSSGEMMSPGMSPRKGVAALRRERRRRSRSKRRDLEREEEARMEIERERERQRLIAIAEAKRREAEEAERALAEAARRVHDHLFEAEGSAVVHYWPAAAHAGEVEEAMPRDIRKRKKRLERERLRKQREEEEKERKRKEAEEREREKERRRIREAEEKERAAAEKERLDREAQEGEERRKASMMLKPPPPLRPSFTNEDMARLISGDASAADEGGRRYNNLSARSTAARRRERRRRARSQLEKARSGLSVSSPATLRAAFFHSDSDAEEPTKNEETAAPKSEAKETKAPIAAAAAAAPTPRPTETPGEREERLRKREEERKRKKREKRQRKKNQAPVLELPAMANVDTSAEDGKTEQLGSAANRTEPTPREVAEDVQAAEGEPKAVGIEPAATAVVAEDEGQHESPPHSPKEAIVAEVTEGEANVSPADGTEAQQPPTADLECMPAKHDREEEPVVIVVDSQCSGTSEAERESVPAPAEQVSHDESATPTETSSELEQQTAPEDHAEEEEGEGNRSVHQQQEEGKGKTPRTNESPRPVDEITEKVATDGSTEKDPDEEEPIQATTASPPAELRSEAAAVPPESKAEALEAVATAADHGSPDVIREDQQPNAPTEEAPDKHDDRREARERENVGGVDDDLVRMRVLYDYEADAEAEGQLDLFSGEIVLVYLKDQREGDPWWFGEVESDGRCGYFPSAFVERDDEEPDPLTAAKSPASARSLHASGERTPKAAKAKEEILPSANVATSAPSSLSTETLEVSQQQQATALPVPPRVGRCAPVVPSLDVLTDDEWPRGLVTSEWTGDQGPDEMVLHLGEVIEVYEQDPSGWWTGAFGEERYGLFPSTCVKMLSKEQSKQLKSVTNVKQRMLNLVTAELAEKHRDEELAKAKANAKAKAKAKAKEAGTPTTTKKAKDAKKKTKEKEKEKEKEKKTSPTKKAGSRLSKLLGKQKGDVTSTNGDAGSEALPGSKRRAATVAEGDRIDQRSLDNAAPAKKRSDSLSTTPSADGSSPVMGLRQAVSAQSVPSPPLQMKKKKKKGKESLISIAVTASGSAGASVGGSLAPPSPSASEKSDLKKKRRGSWLLGRAVGSEEDRNAGAKGLERSASTRRQHLRARVVHDYQPGKDGHNEIYLKKNEVVVVYIKEMTSGMWTGQCESDLSRFGMFPAHCVQVIE